MKNKHLKLSLILLVFFSLIIGFLVFRHNRSKLVKCLKEAEINRKEKLLKLHDKNALTNEAIISIEQTTDREREECFRLYK